MEVKPSPLRRLWYWALLSGSVTLFCLALTAPFEGSALAQVQNGALLFTGFGFGAEATYRLTHRVTIEPHGIGEYIVVGPWRWTIQFVEWDLVREVRALGRPDEVSAIIVDGGGSRVHADVLFGGATEVVREVAAHTSASVWSDSFRRIAVGAI